MTKRNKKYTGKFKDRTPSMIAFSAQDINNMITMGENAVRVLEQGKGTAHYWADLAGRLIVGRELMMTFFHEVDHARTLHDAIGLVAAVYTNSKNMKAGTWLIAKEDGITFREALDIANTAITMVTRREYNQVAGMLTQMSADQLEANHSTFDEYVAGK